MHMSHSPRCRRWTFKGGSYDQMGTFLSPRSQVTHAGHQIEQPEKAGLHRVLALPTVAKSISNGSAHRGTHVTAIG